MLKIWTKQLPGCRIFLENFFGTCSGLPVEANYLNYLMDLKLYSRTNRHIKENPTHLFQAFYEITGTTREEVTERVRGLYTTNKK